MPIVDVCVVDCGSLVVCARFCITGRTDVIR